MSRDRTSQLSSWVELRFVNEKRGTLTELDFHQLPFKPVRVFYITDVPVGAVRGGHAHKSGSQLLYCLNGKIEVELRDGSGEETVICQPDSRGLLINQGVWAQQRYLEENSVLLVLCSHPFDEGEYLPLPQQT